MSHNSYDCWEQLADPLQRLGDSGNYGTQKSDELVFYSSAGCKDFFRGKSFSGNSGSHVGYAGNSEHTDAGMARGQDFGHGGHADEVCSKRTEGMNLPRGLVIGAGKRKIDAFLKIEREASS